MGNESGEWIMHGMKWDNPDCIHSIDEAIKYINKFGFLSLLKNNIDGFSLEERTVPEYWWSDDPEIDPWMWRARVIFLCNVLEQTHYTSESPVRYFFQKKL